MDSSDAITAMQALAQPTRLAIVRELVRAPGAELSAGEIAQRVGASAPAISGHLAILRRAGLVDQKRSGRLVLTAAVADRLAALSLFLRELAQTSE